MNHLYLSQNNTDKHIKEEYQSVLGKTWVYEEEDQRLTLALMQQYDLLEIVARILVKRGHNLESAKHFLNPTLKHLLPNPSQFKDMEKGVLAVVDALLENKKIAIFISNNMC